MDYPLKDDNKDKDYNFKCSQCNTFQNLNNELYYCKECKGYFCDNCLIAHNEIFKEHDTFKLNEETKNNIEDEHNSLLANPDNDLDDRILDENDIYKNAHISTGKFFDIEGDHCTDLEILFNDTLTSIQEIFNEKICNHKSNKCKDDNIGLDINKLKELPPMKRLQVIMDKIDNIK